MTTTSPELRHALDEFEHGLAGAAHALEDIFAPPARPRGAWHGGGLGATAERWFEGVAWAVVMLFAAAWLWSIAAARREPGDPRGVSPGTAAVAAALTSPDRPSTAYLTDALLAAVTPLRGASGRVRVVLRAPGEPVAPTAAVTTLPPAPGAAVQQLALRVGSALRPVADLSVLTLTPLSARRNGRVGLYYVGSWPTERGAARPARGNYAPPRGLVEVTPQTQDTHISEHFTLRDFLTHDQQNVWPKYLVVDPRLVDKLELVLADLEAHGVPARGVHVMSGFRSPQYNAAGGDPVGRAGLSRHMYGDAADIWIDNSGGGQMDDLDHDGRHGIGDAAVIRAAVERVEQAHPELVGGCGIYPGNGAHGPFTHIDARGYQARWIGSGDG